jgi:hypothetical protein
LSASATGASVFSVVQLAMPVSTSATEPYSMAQTISVTMMPIGISRCGIAAFLGRGGNRIESDVGEEDDGRARQHAGITVRREGMPVGGVDRVRRAENRRSEWPRS